MKHILQHRLFHLAVFGAIAMVVAFAVFFSDELREKAQDAREDIARQEEALREIRELEEMLAEDTYGGDTPEETFELFLDALRAGDVNLASKYFVPEKQEVWRKNLEQIRATGYLSNMIEDLVNAEPDRVEGNLAWLSLPGKDAEGKTIYSRISFIKNSTRHKWKISAL